MANSGHAQQKNKSDRTGQIKPEIHLKPAHFPQFVHFRLLQATMQFEDKLFQNQSLLGF